MLYFENLSGAKEDEYFRDGMTEDIITELSKIARIEIFPRSEMLAFRDKPVTAPQVGEKLNAMYVLEGSIRRAGNRLRITTQLVESATRHSVWGERYDRQMEDVFAIQEEISLSIAKALEIKLSPQEEKVIAKKPTANPVAYDFYLRGRSYLRQRQFEYALAMYEEAVKLDPNFALSYAGIAHVWGGMHEFRSPNPEFVEKGLAACAKAEGWRPISPKCSPPERAFSTRSITMTRVSAWRAGPSNCAPNAKAPTMFSGALILPPSATKRPSGSRKAPWKSSAATTTP